MALGSAEQVSLYLSVILGHVAHLSSKPIAGSGVPGEDQSRMCAQNMRPKVIHLYKTLLHLGKEYPKGYDYFRTKLKNAFMKNKDVADPRDIEMLIAKGEYVVKELEALYMLRKYRTLKKRYYGDQT